MPIITPTCWTNLMTISRKNDRIWPRKKFFFIKTKQESMAKFHELRYELLPHPPYSPDLAPSDYFLLPNLKKWLGRKRFYSNNEIISQTNTYFEELEKSYFCGRGTKIGETLDEVYRVQRRLY